MHKIIINADDFGITPGVNKAIRELADAGIVTSTTAMMNMPFHEEISSLKGKIGIGVHFNLTVGKPVLDSRKVLTLIDDEGIFYSIERLLKKMKKKLLSGDDVEAEFDAQVARLTTLGIKSDHIDSHESLIKYPFFMRIMKSVAKRYGILGVRSYSPRKFDYSRLLSLRKTMISLYLALQKRRWEYDGFSTTYKYDSLLKFGLDHVSAIATLRDIFSGLPNGVMEFGVHPGYCDNHTIHLGEYVLEREVETKALLSEQFKAILEESGAELISFKDIRA